VETLVVARPDLDPEVKAAGSSQAADELHPEVFDLRIEVAMPLGFQRCVDLRIGVTLDPLSHDPSLPHSRALHISAPS
jgi:hypothetical protein